jgi:hypothetical protein
MNTVSESLKEIPQEYPTRMVLISGSGLRVRCFSHSELFSIVYEES